jgi:hypothetical protein
MSAVDSEHGGLFFVDGSGGTGKTYLYRALLATIRSKNKIAVATATSGVAASIMPGGRTAHSRFKVPLTLEDGTFCSFTKQSGTAKLLPTASLIIWDEVTMMKRQGVEALDNSLRDIMDHAGKRIFLPQIPLCPSDDEMFPFQFKRKQFPIRLSFAMTVSKTQGQTIPNAGVYFPEPVFSHGQLYVALSRATARSNVKILAVPPSDKKDKKKKTKINGTYTKNIVYKEVLTL